MALAVPHETFGLLTPEARQSRVQDAERNQAST